MSSLSALIQEMRVLSGVEAPVNSRPRFKQKRRQRQKQVRQVESRTREQLLVENCSLRRRVCELEEEVELLQKPGLRKSRQLESFNPMPWDIGREEARHPRAASPPPRVLPRIHRRRPLRRVHDIDNVIREAMPTPRARTQKPPEPAPVRSREPRWAHMDYDEGGPITEREPRPMPRFQAPEVNEAVGTKREVRPLNRFADIMRNGGD
jgi:hypothetical protein